MQPSRKEAQVTNDKLPTKRFSSMQIDKKLTAMETITPKRLRSSPRITADEEERRRQHVASAYSHNRIEGKGLSPLVRFTHMLWVVGRDGGINETA